MKKYLFYLMALLTIGAIVSLFCFDTAVFAAGNDKTGYSYWRESGKKAAMRAFEMMTDKGISPRKGDLITLTDAGYAEIEGETTSGLLDGLSAVTGCSRGAGSLIEIHSRYDAHLWCAIHDRRSGYCVYLEFRPSGSLKSAGKESSASDLFSISAIEKIDAENLYKNSKTLDKKFKDKIFGGNEFRIVTIANAMAHGAPYYALRAFEYHDHYCPGVTSGIMMVSYIKKHFAPSPDGALFVQSVQPWCKEDALMTLLNATPGKGGYSALFSTEADRAKWKDEAKNASTIIYREDKATGRWDGIVLGFRWADCPECSGYGEKSIMTKLCMDLHYLDKLGNPEEFLTEIKRFTLPEGVSPREWAAPGVDPMVRLGLVKTE